MLSEDAKKIVDAHFSENYEYYKRVCLSYYKGRYLADDLLQESYISFLKINPNTINEFYNINRLHNLGLLTIRQVYQKRKIHKKNKSKYGTSILFESASRAGYSHVENYSDKCLSSKSLEIELKSMFELASKTIQKTLTEQPDEKNNNYLNISVFLKVASSQETINSLAKKIKVSRYLVEKTYNQGRDYLKKEILNNHEPHTTLS